MRLNEIINRFALVSGLEPEEVSKWTVICCDASMEIERMVRPDVKLTENDELRLSNGAGVLAYYKYCLYEYGARVKSFAAGSVNVTMALNEAEHANRLWNTEKESLSDILCTDGDFCFQGVRA